MYLTRLDGFLFVLREALPVRFFDCVDRLDRVPVRRDWRRLAMSYKD